MSEIEKLKAECDCARVSYELLCAPADEAYKKYKAASKAFKEAELYEKAKRQVIRDLLREAGKESK